MKAAELMFSNGSKLLVSNAIKPATSATLPN
jgi:hypothetical protein